ncbi:hypothetical protein CVS37_21980 [Burkholderia lata]|nr:hypothetical protein CVS37_21980 [Burkholderia lata]
MTRHAGAAGSGRIAPCDGPCADAAAARGQPQCRIGVHRAPSARTAMSHGDSAAAHHICASLPHGASCAARSRASRNVR